MRLAAIAAALAATLLTVTHAPALVRDAVFAKGTVPVSHDYCDSIGFGEVRMSLTRPAGTTAVSAWNVHVHAKTTAGCSAHAAGRCIGLGNLSDGVDLTQCFGDVDGGRFGLVVVCIPGPARPTTPVRGRAQVTIDGVNGIFEGEIDAVLTPGAAEEAQNLCL